MTRISVVIITLNEERNIRRCLDSVRRLTDDIVVIDSCSTDNTESICREYGVNFVTQPWLGYSEQKNLGNKVAKNDWILSIDADEALDETLQQSITSADITSDSRMFSMNRMVNYCGKWVRHCGWYPDKKIRLFNRKTTRWEGVIHETLVVSDNTEVVHLKGDILHYTYYSTDEHYRQADKFSTMTAQQAYDKGKKSSWFKIITNPCWKFIRDFIIKLGFLDGYTGFTICRISAYATYQKYKKLRDLWQR